MPNNRDVFLRSNVDIAECLELMGCEYIGSGVHRDVYTFGKDSVIKVARCDEFGVRIDGINANSYEYNLWQGVAYGKRYNKLRRWLAPCGSMSFGGVALVQEKTTPATREQLPKRLPNWMTDLSSKNGGILNGRFVFHDYAITLATNSMEESHKLITHDDELWYDLRDNGRLDTK